MLFVCCWDFLVGIFVVFVVAFYTFLLCCSLFTFFGCFGVFCFLFVYLFLLGGFSVEKDFV